MLERVTAGERLSADEIRELAGDARHPAARHAGRRAAPAAARHAGDLPARRRRALRPVVRRRGAAGGARGAAHRRAADAGRRRRPPCAARRRSPGDRTVSGFSWARRRPRRWRRRDRDRRACSKRCATAGLDAIAELPLDTHRRSRAAIERAGDRGLSSAAADDRQAPPAAERLALLLQRAPALQERVRLHPGAQPAADGAQRVPADDRLRGREDGGDGAAGGAEHPDHPGGLVALRPEAGAGGADVRRRRLDGVPPSDEAPEGRRRAPLEEVRRNIEAAGFSPPSATAASPSLA